MTLFPEEIAMNDDSSFMDKLKDLVEQKDIEALYAMGLCYEFGFITGTPELGEAIKLYLEAARYGHASAQITLARFFRDGIKVAKNEEKSAAWVKAAAEQRAFSAGFHKQTVDKYKLAIVPTAASSSGTSAANSSNRKKIVIVEDSKTIRLFLTEALTEMGYEVVQAENGFEGLELIKSLKTIDLILSDINMPRMDGLTMIHNIRTTTNHKSTPIVVLTTQSDKETILTARKFGVSGWLVKPPEVAAIKAMLEKVFTPKSA
jgi:two-component system chemotaxis response regulator CheY